ncbi:hypothetical protein BDV97DRAFT_397251 [Delphinella strobiligena]|nr:hypothetical protein BDV97DRAFT_397251 [Delphinella strobiligena]
MLPALRLRRRVSCLSRQSLEPRGLLQPRRRASSGQWNEKSRREPAGQNWRQNHVENRNQSRNPKEQARIDYQNQKQGLGLLEELFPEEASRLKNQERREREVPRLQLDVPDVLTPDLSGVREQPRTQSEIPLDKAAYWENYRDTRRQYAHLERQGLGITVLVLRNASKNLTEEDFRRVIPQGRHIEGWALERGDILKVIPGRDTSTLERQNFYFILFNAPVSAFAYQTHVTRLHKLAQSQTPTSLLSPVPPPPGYLVNGEDIDNMIQSYSLVPLSQEISLRQLAPPLTLSVHQIVLHKGYPNLLIRPDRSPVEVMLRLEGPQLGISHIRSALNKAARDRGMPWTGKETYEMKISRWDIKGTNISPLSRRGFKELKERTFGAMDKSGKQEDENDQAGEDEDQEARGKPRQTQPGYIIGFDTESEAQTFVAFWHRRAMELADFHYEGDDVAPLVNVDILW